MSRYFKCIGTLETTNKGWAIKCTIGFTYKLDHEFTSERVPNTLTVYFDGYPILVDKDQFVETTATLKQNGTIIGTIDPQQFGKGLENMVRNEVHGVVVSENEPGLWPTAKEWALLELKKPNLTVEQIDAQLDIINESK